MSRTDHHMPAWVRALHAHRGGLRTSESHHYACHHYDGHWHPTHLATWVRHDVAEKNGWAPSRIAHVTSTHGMYRVPVASRECDIDTAVGRCHRWLTNAPTRWYGGIRVSREEIRRDYFRPERAAVRDALRTATKEHRATGEVDTDPPVRQTRNGRWNGGWWD